MSSTTRYWHYIAYKAFANEQNAICWCRGHNETPGRWCRACQRRWLAVDAASIANDLEIAASLAGPCPRWRGRQEVIWEDRLCKALLAEVAW